MEVSTRGVCGVSTQGACGERLDSFSTFANVTAAPVMASPRGSLLGFLALL